MNDHNMILVVVFVRAATYEASSEWRLRPNFRACHVRDSWNLLTGAIKNPAISYLKCAKVRLLLYLIGENLDKDRAHYQAETGKLVQLMRGIYVDADADIDAIVLRSAVRIAHYLYPKAYLSAASATLLAPTREGRLFISGKRNQRTRIRSLEIIQNVAPDQPAVATAIVDDGAGEFKVAVSSMRQRFVEAFRQRSEHASAIDEGMRTETAARLIEEYGSPSAAADAVWALARENKWYREGEQTERYLLRSAVAVASSTYRILVNKNPTPSVTRPSTRL